MSLWVSLGSLLGPLEVLLGGLWIQKHLKNLKFFKVFENAAFWLFEAPDGSLGLILPPLWPIWSQNEPQKIPQICCKKKPKIIHFFLFDFFQKYNSIKIRRIKVHFWTPIWTSTFAQNSKRFTRETKMSPRGPSLALKSQQLPLKNLKKPNGF